MVDADLSALHHRLLDYGIDESVASELDHIHQSGIVCRHCMTCSLIACHV